MKKQYFVMSDIHGCFKEFQGALKNWKKETQTLVVIGDLEDRGKDSYQVITYLMKLQKDYDVVVTMGNHDRMFLDYLEKKGTSSIYLLNGGGATLKSFVSDERAVSAKAKVEIIKDEHQDIISWLSSLPLYYETEKYIFVHAGVNVNLKDWKNSTEMDFLWSRDMQYSAASNETGKTIVFGHTPTRFLNKDGSDEIYYSSCGTKIGVDGGCVFGGQLNTLVLEE